MIPGRREWIRKGLPLESGKRFGSIISLNKIYLSIYLYLYLYLYIDSYIYIWTCLKWGVRSCFQNGYLRGKNGHHIGRSQNEVPCSILESNILGTQKCTLYVPTERHHGIVYFRYTRLMFSGLEILEPKNHHRTSMQHFPSKHHIDPYWSILW